MTDAIGTSDRSSALGVKPKKVGTAAKAVKRPASAVKAPGTTQTTWDMVKDALTNAAKPIPRKGISRNAIDKYIILTYKIEPGTRFRRLLLRTLKSRTEDGTLIQNAQSYKLVKPLSKPPMKAVVKEIKTVKIPVVKRTKTATKGLAKAPKASNVNIAVIKKSVTKAKALGKASAASKATPLATKKPTNKELKLTKKLPTVAKRGTKAPKSSLSVKKQPPARMLKSASKGKVQ